MNSYFLAIIAATNNGNSPQFNDLWRNYHPTANLGDSDYQDMTDEHDLLVPWCGVE